jgi:hypothetical protein
MNAYTNNGFTDRADYLESLCDEYDADTVHMLADLLGPEEDFDGLVTGLEDHAAGY